MIKTFIFFLYITVLTLHNLQAASDQSAATVLSEKDIRNNFIAKEFDKASADLQENPEHYIQFYKKEFKIWLPTRPLPGEHTPMGKENANTLMPALKQRYQREFLIKVKDENIKKIWQKGIEAYEADKKKRQEVKASKKKL